MRGYNEYIGARYVPLFPGEWDNTREYEPLMVVSYQGNSYTSKTFVPKNVNINNTTYWALTGNYNAQVEAYRQEVQRLIEKSLNKMSVYVSVQEMLNDDIEVGIIATTKCYENLGDGGEATFIITDTTPDTALYLELSNHNYAVLVPEENYINPIALGALDNPALLSTLTNFNLNLHNAVVSLSEDIEVGTIKNANFNVTNANILVDTAFAKLENINISVTNNDDEKSLLTIGSKEVELINSTIGSYLNTKGIAIEIKSLHSDNITYNCIFSNLSIVGCAYGVRFTGANSVTQCIFNNIKFNFTYNTCISVDDANTYCAQHEFNNIVFGTQQNSIGINCKKLYSSTFNNVTNFNDGGDDTSVYPVYHEGASLSSSNITIGYQNYFNNCAFEGKLGGNRIACNIFNNCQVRNSTINEVNRNVNFGTAQNNILGNFADITIYPPNGNTTVTKEYNYIKFVNSGESGNADIIVPNAMLQKLLDYNAFTLAMYTDETVAVQCRWTGTGENFTPLTRAQDNTGKSIGIYCNTVDNVRTHIENGRNLEIAFNVPADTTKCIYMLSIAEHFYTIASCGLGGNPKNIF